MPPKNSDETKEPIVNTNDQADEYKKTRGRFIGNMYVDNDKSAEYAEQQKRYREQLAQEREAREQKQETGESKDKPGMER